MDDRLWDDIQRFFEQAPAALPLYEALQAAVFALDGCGPVTVKVGKTQIGFYDRCSFARRMRKFCI